MPHQMHRRKLRFGIQAKVIALTVFFTFVIAATVMLTSVSYLSAQIKSSSLQAAEYQLQTASASILQRITEIDSLLDWCIITPSVRTPMLTAATRTGQNTVYTLLSNKYNSMSTALYLQRFLVASTNGYLVMMGTASSQSSGVSLQSLPLLPGMGEDDAGTAWEQLIYDPLMQANISMLGIPVARTTSASSGSYQLSIYLSVSPTVVTDVLRGFALDERSSLFWYMGDTVYRVNGSTLVPLSMEQIQLEPETDESISLDAETLLYRVTIEDALYLVIACPVGAHGLYLAEAIENAPLSDQLPQLIGPFLILLFAILLLGSFLTLLLHYVVNKPIQALQQQIDTVAEGHFTTNPDIEWNNELGDVGRGINALSRNVTALMDKRVEDEKKRLDLEYQMLQKQITPHFIYNTLNSIKWMATIQHVHGIGEMVTALSRLLKHVSKSTQKLIPLEQEFSLLNDYFTIQRYRYGGTVSMEIHIQTEERIVQECLIPQFSLQPLAENAIFHGIEPKGCVGEIEISVLQEDGTGDILIRMADDGVGMTQEQIDKALLTPDGQDSQNEFHHVGLKNVHRRLQYSFGPEYGLEIESAPGVGTTILVRLPSPDRQKEETALC